MVPAPASVAPAAGGFGAYLWNVARWGLAATISDIKLLERVGETFRAYHGRGIVEVLLICTIVYLFVMKPTERAPRGGVEELTEQEIDDLCKEWQPEPLVPPAQPAAPRHAVVMDGPPLPRVRIEGRSLLNMGTSNFLGMSGRDDVQKRCAMTIERYGMGACGPRGFYGTIDVHLDLEKQLADFLGTEECIIYSSDIATVSSVIPAFAKRLDVVIRDEGCNYAIQQGCQLSRAHLGTFRQNDPGDLDAAIDKMERRLKGRPLTRRFVVVEGLYQDWGDLSPLREIVAVAERRKYRVILDDSFGIGVLGRTGRGSLEHHGMRATDVMAVVGSMSGSLGSIGGFCAGNVEVVDHQRLAGAGYCFSAALPPFLATAASAALELIQAQEGQELLRLLRRNAARLRALLRGCPGLEVHGEDEESPIVMLFLEAEGERARAGRDEQVAMLDRVAQEAMARGLLVSVSQLSYFDVTTAPVALKLQPMALHTERDLEEAARIVKEAAGIALKG